MAHTVAAPASVVAVCLSRAHDFPKPGTTAIRLLAGLGVEGDAYLGATVKHRSRVARDPSQPNLRQVHLIHHELLDELNAGDFGVVPGALGENVTTRGIDLLGLPAGALLALGVAAVVDVAGLRNPCIQLDRYRPGLMQATLDRDADGALMRKAGVMAIVRTGGAVRPGDPIAIALPSGPRRPLVPA